MVHSALEDQLGVNVITLNAVHQEANNLSMESTAMEIELEQLRTMNEQSTVEYETKRSEVMQQMINTE